MVALPVVVVLATEEPLLSWANSQSQPAAVAYARMLRQTLKNALRTGLPMVLISPAKWVQPSQEILSGRDIVVLPDKEEAVEANPASLGYGMAMGVGARPHAVGWIMLPAQMCDVQPKTISVLAQHLAEQTIVYPEFAGRMGRPLGFAAELYSELITLQNNQGMRRLSARYPAQAINVNDAGVLMGQEHLCV